MIKGGIVYARGGRGGAGIGSGKNSNCDWITISGGTVDAYGGAFDLKDNEVQEMRDALKTMEYDDYDRLIQLCDNISGASGIMRMEDRIADIISRYSHFPEEKRQATFGLVDYFEQKTGKDIYQLACGGHTVDHY